MNRNLASIAVWEPLLYWNWTVLKKESNICEVQRILNVDKNIQLPTGLFVLINQPQTEITWAVKKKQVYAKLGTLILGSPPSH